MEFIIVIGFIVFVIASMIKDAPRYNADLARQKKQAELDAAEDARFAALVELANGGDKQAIGLLRCFGYDCHTHGWE